MADTALFLVHHEYTVYVVSKLDTDSTCVANCQQLSTQVSVCTHPFPSMRCWVLCKMETRLSALIARRHTVLILQKGTDGISGWPALTLASPSLARAQARRDRRRIGCAQRMKWARAPTRFGPGIYICPNPTWACAQLYCVTASMDAVNHVSSRRAGQCINSENEWFFEATVTGISLTEDEKATLACN